MSRPGAGRLPLKRLLSRPATGRVPLKGNSGDICNKNGKNGVCTYFRECPTALEDLVHNREIQNCGYSGSVPIVCCVPPPGPTTTTTTTSRPIHTTTKRSPSKYTTEYIPPVETYKKLIETEENTCPPVKPHLTSTKTGQKAWDKCIDYQELVFPCVRSMTLLGGFTRVNRCRHNADELVKGGNKTNPYEFPHMALLGYGSNIESLDWKCGGSLVSEKFVLTAAHCLATNTRIPVSYVALGISTRSEVKAHNVYKIQKHHRHPKYNPDFSYNDIALLELEKTVPLSDLVVPACLHSKNPVDDIKASATGWGHTIHEVRGSTSEDLRKAILDRFDFHECEVKYESNYRKLPRGFDPSSQLCYGDRLKTKDTCQGDSGGPLQLKNKEIACMYTVIGVTSLGKACLYAPTEPGIYTRVFPYLDWIERIVWP